MIKCLICNSNTNLNKFKTINKTQIYECTKCQIAIIPKNTNLNIKKIYDFDKYDQQKKRYEKRFKNLINILTKYKKGGDVLDIGAGFGLLSSIIEKNNNFHPEAIEPFSKPRYLLNTKIYKMTLEKFFKVNKKKYDVIILMDIIEHFKNPKKILSALSKILNRNGIVVIQTPNYISLMSKIVKNWSWWMTEDHKLIFSMKSIKTILGQSNYKILHKHTYEDLFDMKKNFDGNFTDIKTPLIRRLIKMFIYTLFFPTYVVLRFVLWKLNYGGLIFIIAQKKQ
jgi:2-polyprenyl-3-methyl-5-hydroxy-6-metoxy-1,4-benzoquinol methylase